MRVGLCLATGSWAGGLGVVFTAGGAARWAVPLGFNVVLGDSDVRASCCPEHKVTGRIGKPRRHFTLYRIQQISYSSQSIWRGTIAKCTTHQMTVPVCHHPPAVMLTADALSELHTGDSVQTLLTD